MKKYLLTALALVLALTQQEAVSQNVSKQFVNAMTAGKYTLKFRSEQKIGNETVTLEAVQYASGDKMAFVGKQGDHNIKIIARDGKAYMIDETSKKIFTMPSADDAKEMGLKVSKFKFSKSGQEAFLGKNLPYDEYIIDKGTMRMYVDKGKLVGFKVTANGGEPAVVEITDFSDKVDESVFNLPAGYDMVGL